MPIAIQDNPVIITISPEERARGVASQATILKAIVAIAEDGLVVLDNAIDLSHIDALNRRMVKEAEDLINRPTTHFNSPGNLSQVPPICADLMFEDVFANPFAAAIIEGMLGPHPEVRYLHGNTAMRGEERQDVHADLAWRHWHWPFGLVVNIMLIEADKTNGSTEVWLGTHRDTTLADHIAPDAGVIKPELLAKRRSVRPPIQPRIPKGGMIIRDLRLWHAGMPNGTDIPRCMMAMVHTPAWLGNKLLLTLPESVQPIIESWKGPVRYCAEYIDDKNFDHLALEFKYDMSPGGGLPKNERDKWEAKWIGEWGHKF